MIKTLKVRALVIAVAATVTAELTFPALADPPPWAPAHGRRAKQGPKPEPVPARAALRLHVTTAFGMRSSRGLHDSMLALRLRAVGASS